MRGTAIALLALALPACSLLSPRLEPPKLSVVGVELLRGDLFHQELRVRLRVNNPNDRALPVKGLSYRLELEGQEFAHGVSGASFVVPALGEADFDMSMSANMAGALATVLGQGGRPVEYHITGAIALSSGLLRSKSFDERGTFRWQ